MLSLRARTSKSWLDTRHAPRLAADLADRLTARCKGERGVFITLTYRRDEWDSPEELYWRTKEERHVRRFIERLGNLLGESLTGRWLCKLEFQRGGWVHWHIVLLGRQFIEHAMLDHAWGFGHVWINRLSQTRLRYLCKYVAKGDDLPEFLYLEPVRSLKVVRASPGFWGKANDDEERREPPERADRSQRLTAYVPIGTMIRRAERETLVRNDETGKFVRVGAHVGTLVLRLLGSGARFAGYDRGWVQLDGATVRAAARWARREAAARPPGVHLIGTRNPPRVSHMGFDSSRKT